MRIPSTLLPVLRGALLLGLGTTGLATGCAGDTVDQGGTPLCTQALYDTCHAEHDCTSNDCHTFPTAGFEACSQACNATTPCPDQEGVAVACNATGYCEPAAPRTCRVKLI
jgi:hypothetical protein